MDWGRGRYANDRNDAPGAGGYGDEADMADLSVDDNQPFDIGTDERRMHVRAYNHWVSLLGGRAYPTIDDIEPENIADFGPHSVLLDFTDGIDDPIIRFLGSALRQECDLDGSVIRISQVPGRSLLSRLTDHYLQIIANRAPIGFEAEFLSMRGYNTMYRGILMPFSSDGETIDFIYGVINWKELADPATQAALDAEVAAAVRAAPPPPPAAPVWADGPSGGFDQEDAPSIPADDVAFGFDYSGIATGLADQLTLAQQSAAAVRAADTRSRAALYRALGRAYDFSHAVAADPDSYAELLARAGLLVQARAPMTPIIKLVFGSDYDKTRVTEFATVLAFAHDSGVGVGGLSAFLDGVPGGIKGVVRAARVVRRPADKADQLVQARRRLAARPSLASVAMRTNAAVGDYVVLIARADAGGVLDIIASAEGNAALTAQAIRHAAR